MPTVGPDRLDSFSRLLPDISLLSWGHALSRPGNCPSNLFHNLDKSYNPCRHHSPFNCGHSLARTANRFRAAPKNRSNHTSPLALCLSYRRDSLSDALSHLSFALEPLLIS